MAEQEIGMDREAIISNLRAFLEKSSQGQPFSDDEDLLARGLLDSLLILAMVAHVEDSFGIQLDFDDLTEDSFKSLSAMSELVFRKAS